jgi:glycosyltransferase involved in cell wall biosynthesis
VSVIVPNFNHARYLPRRLQSIVTQTFRDVEILVLDDASTDDSLAVIAPWRDRADVRVIANAHNSGSPFAQWLRGLDEAQGEFVWIAESDDACAPDFLETLLALLRDPSVAVAYANSLSIDDRDEVTGDYATGPYLSALSTAKWQRPYRVAGAREVSDGFGVKNTILSASAVLFRRFAIDDALRADLARLRLAGDWRFFAEAMRGGEIAYTPRPLNYHRRHDASVVGRLLAERRAGDFYREVAEVQRWIVTHYPLDEAFAGKWEAYLREQWAAFYPDRPFAEIAGSYPLEPMRALIASASRPA